MADIRTTEQDRVSSALRHTASLVGNDVEMYFQDAVRFGPLVVTNGLAGAVAFLAERGRSRRQFLRSLEEWLLNRPAFGRLQGGTLLEKLGDRACDAATYRLMTQEALLYANWLKRLSGAKRAAKGDATKAER
jgi:CRISPR/Cas system CMR-associated protein Cmr5 small subunit